MRISTRKSTSARRSARNVSRWFEAASYRIPAILSGSTLTRKPGTSRLDAGLAVVLSPAAYNGRIGLVVCCPVTTRIKGYPFEVPLSGSPPCVVLADQVKSLDWRTRGATRKGAATREEMAVIRAKIRALIGT
jgi:mRNA interferase MazF